MRWGAFGVGLIAAAWASGCDSAEREFSEPPPAPACDPGSNSTALGDDCAIFVAPTGDDASAGSKEKPLRTLGKAVLAAKGSGVGRVYACRGIYDEALVIPPGITLVGALDCYEGTWAPTDDKSVIAGAADKVAVRFLAGEKIVLDGFKVVAANASAPGGSSIAAIAAPEASVDIRRSEISAGDGAVGVDGEDGVPGLDAPPVDLLNEGQPLCSGTKGNPGGPPHMNSCGDDGELSIGGEGGFGGIDTGGDGSSGEPVSPGTGEGGVTGAACFKVGGSGHAGAAGADGAPGAPGAGLGLLTVAEGWVGVTGGAGGRGAVGQGGGGGAGQKGKVLCAGASGGSGGSGGCGGVGGKGGISGGSSVALVSIHATVTLVDVVLKSGSGAAGGRGGSGQAGGLGALGAVGGSNKADTTLLPGCGGGKGGDGGKGAPGGGGSGGHSAAIAYVGVAPAGSYEATFGAPGVGGLGGNENVAANAGSDGVAQKTLEIIEPTPG